MFIHGDLQIEDGFVTDDVVSGVIDWSEAGLGDALYDLGTLTLGHPEHLGDVLVGHGTDGDRDLLRALEVAWLPCPPCAGQSNTATGRPTRTPK